MKEQLKQVEQKKKKSEGISVDGMCFFLTASVVKL